MKRTLPVVILMLALTITAFKLLRPLTGEVTEIWETTNHVFSVRVERRAEKITFGLAGAYYVFQSASANRDDWHEVFTFRHDDPVQIPREQVRFVNERVGYIFMGWNYAVTTDAGASWSVWDARRDLPDEECCNYGLIETVNVAPDGRGAMTLDLIRRRGTDVSKLYTTDFGRHWDQEAHSIN